MLLMYSQHAGESGLAFISRIRQSALIFKLLMWSFVGVSSNYVFGTLLTANNNLKTLNTIALIGLMLNFGLNWILIPRFHAVGSAVATLVTQIATALLQVTIAFVTLHLKNKPGMWFRLFLLLIGTFLTALAFQQLNFGSWIWRLALLAGAGILLGIMFKTLDIRQFITVLSEKQDRSN